jgi:hypothetical protein
MNKGEIEEQFRHHINIFKDLRTAFDFIVLNEEFGLYAKFLFKNAISMEIL